MRRPAARLAAELVLLAPGASRARPALSRGGADLRGFGDSSKPLTGYDTLTVGRDIVRLLDHLGVARAGLVGHDFGAATAYAIAAEWRDRVSALAILDMLIPGFGLEDAVRFGPDGFGLWHLAFHAAPDVPEMLIAGREREYLGWFFRNHAYDPTAVTAEALSVYAETSAKPVPCGRPWATTARSMKTPSRTGALPRPGSPFRCWHWAVPQASRKGSRLCMRRLAGQVDGDTVPGAGHWIAEEQPAWLAERLLAFFTANAAEARA